MVLFTVFSEQKNIRFVRTFMIKHSNISVNPPAYMMRDGQVLTFAVQKQTSST